MMRRKESINFLISRGVLSGIVIFGLLKDWEINFIIDIALLLLLLIFDKVYFMNFSSKRRIKFSDIITLSSLLYIGLFNTAIILIVRDIFKLISYLDFKKLEIDRENVLVGIGLLIFILMKATLRIDSLIKISKGQYLSNSYIMKMSFIAIFILILLKIVIEDKLIKHFYKESRKLDKNEAKIFRVIYYLEAFLITVLIVYFFGKLNIYAFFPTFIFLEIINSIIKLEKVSKENKIKLLSEKADLYWETVRALATIIDAKDQNAYGHIIRVQFLSLKLAEKLGIKDEEIMESLRIATLLHDIGKLAVPDYILNKPSKLTKFEFEKIKSHPLIGAAVLSSISFPPLVIPTVLYHHEHYDGTGYPMGIKGDKIPLTARILCIADCYDALRSDRPFRSKFSVEETKKILKEGAGKIFDPKLLDKFLELIDEVEEEMKELTMDYNITRKQLTDVNPMAKPAVGLEKELSQQDIYSFIAKVQQEFTTIFNLSIVLSNTIEFEALVNLIPEKLKDIVNFEGFLLMFKDKNNNCLEIYKSVGFEDISLQKKRVRLNIDSSLKWVIDYNTLAINVDLRKDFLKLFGKECPYLSTLIFPLSLSEHVIGLCALFRKDANSFNKEDSMIIEMLAPHITIAIHNARTYSQSQLYALTDSLTSIHNSRYLFLIDEKKIENAKIKNRKLALLMIDINDFKSFNDNYGHLVGDKILKEFAKVLKKSVRKSDSVIRYAGDEFIIILYDCDKKDYFKVIERIVKNIRNLKVKIDDGKVLSIEASIGASFLPDDANNLSELLKIADKRMYKNKVLMKKGENLLIRLEYGTNDDKKSNN